MSRIGAPVEAGRRSLTRERGPARARLRCNHTPERPGPCVTYDAVDRRTQQNLPATPNPVITTWVYDAADRLSSLTSARNGTTLDSHTYTRDAVGNLTQEVVGGANPATSTYTYDDLYRLSSASVAGTSYGYVYDPVGNRTSQTVAG